MAAVTICSDFGAPQNSQIGRASCRERVTDFIFLGSKITADGDCSHGIKRCLLLGRKAMTNLDSILKSINSSVLSFVYVVQLSHPYMTTGNTIALTRWTFVGKVMSLLFNNCLGWSKLFFQAAGVF